MDSKKTHRMKMDINNLFRQIDDLLSVNQSEEDWKTGFGIAVGLELLGDYIRQIAERTIELNDEVLIGLLLDLHVLKEVEGNG